MAPLPATRMESWAASFAVALCGAVWGIYWLPLRHLQHAGLSGSWATFGFFVAAARSQAEEPPPPVPGPLPPTPGASGAVPPHLRPLPLPRSSVPLPGPRSRRGD